MNNPFAAKPEYEEKISAPLSDAAREKLRQATNLEEIIRATDNPSEVMTYMMEGKQLESLDQANEFLGQIQDKWNTTPRPELFEHSPKEAAYLLYELPSEIGKVLFGIDLSEHEGAIMNSKLFRNWKAMLEYFSTHDAGMTASGNLNRKAVEELKTILKMSPALAEHPEWIRNEHDWEELNTLRMCAQFAGLLRRRKGKWRASRKCTALLAQNSPSAIYLFLFDAWFNQLDWGTLYFRDILEQIHFQSCRYLVLSGLARVASDWTDYAGFLRKLFLEHLNLRLRRNETARYARSEEDELDFLFRYPLFVYLEGMGVVEMNHNSETIRKIRMTELGKGLIRSLSTQMSPKGFGNTGILRRTGVGGLASG